MKLALTLVLFLVHHTLFAQSNTGYRFTVSNGLPSNQVYDIIEDNFGYLWFSTDRGLCRYDGQTFQTYDKTDGLIDNVVFDFYKRPDGKIWCTTSNSGLFYFEGADPTFHPFPYNDTLRKYIPNLVFHSLSFDPSGAITFGSHFSNGFTTISPKGKPIVKTDDLYDRKRWRVSLLEETSDQSFFYFTQEPFNEKTPFNKKVIHSSSFYSDSKQILPKSEAIYIPAQRAAVFTCTPVESNILIDNQAIPFYPKHEAIASGVFDTNYFWLGYHSGGAEVYNVAGELIHSYLEGYSVTQLYRDREENLWASTLYNGVFKLAQNFIAPPLAIEASQKQIFSLSKDFKGGIYAGTNLGDIYHLDAQKQETLFYQSTNRKHPAIIFPNVKDSMCLFSSDHVLFSMTDTLVNPTEVRFALLHDRLLYYGAKTLFSLDPENGDYTILFRNLKIHDAEIIGKQMYVGGKRGLASFSIDSPDKLKHHKVKARVNDLNSLKGLIVAATKGEGIYYQNKISGNFNQITTKDGLLSNFIRKVEPENDSVLWVATDQGLNRILFKSPTEFSVQSITKYDGLSSNQINDLLVGDSCVWVSSDAGIDRILLDQLPEGLESPRKLLLHWTEIKNNGVLSAENHKFSHEETEFTFGFKATSFRTQDIQYRYRLNGLANRWTNTTNTSLVFQKLAPGNYQLTVQAKTSKCSWTDNVIDYQFTIHPPFWDTTWFLAACFLFGATLIYLFFKFQVFTYNQDIVRAIMRQILKRLQKSRNVIEIKHLGKSVSIPTDTIHYLKTDGNYLEIYTQEKSYVIRSSFQKFLDQLPDQIEFQQVHRSFVVRLDKIQEKSGTELTLLNTPIPVSRKYKKEIQAITFS